MCFDITNPYTPKQTSITVTKYWDDSNSQDDFRPDSIQVKLYTNGEKIKEPINLSKASKWTYTWKNFSKKKKAKISFILLRKLRK
ncbi:Cna B-type domain-containing protein [Lactococcus petauri]|uniref:CNA-B domain-containing protein n=1 Tax=Lactococcus petauri TaxID=1940789 RepID=A0A252CAI0_9LACT|nr:hypothetical protein BZZ03_11025 [Lactococcus petauri]